jgi:hypothetical protein
MHIQPVFVDSVTHTVNVLGIDLRKTIDNVKLVPAQSQSSVSCEYHALQTKGFELHRYAMKNDSLKRFVAGGENMDFMAKIS